MQRNQMSFLLSFLFLLTDSVDGVSFRNFQLRPNGFATQNTLVITLSVGKHKHD